MGFSEKAAALKKRSFEEKARALKASPPAEPTQAAWDQQIAAAASGLEAVDDRPLAGIGVTPEQDATVARDRAEAAAIAARRPAPEAPTGLEALLPGSAQVPPGQRPQRPWNMMRSQRLRQPQGPVKGAVQDALQSLALSPGLKAPPPPRQYDQIPREGPLDSLLNTSNDAVMSGQQAALMNWGDNFSQNPEATRRRLELARQRSPTASAYGNAAGNVYTSALTAAAPITGGALLGGLNAAGAADDLDTVDTLKEFGKGAAVGTLLGGAGKAVSGTGRMLRNAPQGLPNMIRGATETQKSWWPGLADVRGFAVDLASGNFPAAGKSGAMYLARRVPVVRDYLARAGEKIAGSPLTAATARGMQHAGDVVPSRASLGGVTGYVSANLGQAIGAPEQMSSEQTTKQGNGNLLPEAALTALQNTPEVFGRYRDEVARAAASPDQGSVSALISRLTQSDPNFRAEVLPHLQKLTAQGSDE